MPKGKYDSKTPGHDHLRGKPQDQCKPGQPLQTARDPKNAACIAYFAYGKFDEEFSKVSVHLRLSVVAFRVKPRILLTLLLLLITLHSPLLHEHHHPQSAHSSVYIPHLPDQIG